MASTLRKKRDVWSLVSIAIIAMYALILIYPLFILLRRSVIVDGHFTLEAFKTFFSRAYYVDTIFNSFKAVFGKVAQRR